MKILVLGGGVIGVASAYYLNKAGHEVTVIDRAEAVGMETSFANGGQISWGAGDPWAAPGIAWTARSSGCSAALAAGAAPAPRSGDVVVDAPVPAQRHARALCH